MAETLGMITELQAVNEIIASIGEAPITTLVTMPPDAVTAQDILYRTSRNLQQRGWHFNTDIDVELTPDGSGWIIPATNVLQIDATSIDVALRGDSTVMKLWDRDDLTFVFTVATLKCDIIYHFVWLDIPQHVREYIIVLAIKDFLLGFPGHAQDRNTARLLEHKFQRAQSAFFDIEVGTSDPNILTNTSISTILRRT